MATSGAQPGNQNAARAKRWQQAIQRALSRASGKDIDTGLDSAADKLVALALEGDKWAIDHLADRIDGKPPQAIIGGGDDDPPISVREILIRAVNTSDRSAKEGE